MTGTNDAFDARFALERSSSRARRGATRGGIARDLATPGRLASGLSESEFDL